MKEVPQYPVFRKMFEDAKNAAYYMTRESPLADSGEEVSNKWALLDYPDGLPDQKDLDLDPGVWIVAHSAEEKLAAAFKVRPAEKERSTEAANARTTAYLLAECRKELERKNREIDELCGLTSSLEEQVTELLEENLVLKEEIKSLKSQNSEDAVDVFVGSILEAVGIPVRQAGGL